MKPLAFAFALLLAGLEGFDGLSSPAAQTSTAADGTMRAVTAANAFLATLSPAERSKVLPRAAARSASAVVEPANRHRDAGRPGAD
jgi:hypothetical protein